MACFLVPAAEAVITTIAAKAMKSKEKEETTKISFANGIVEDATKIKFSTKLGWLRKRLRETLLRAKMVEVTRYSPSRRYSLHSYANLRLLRKPTRI